MKRKCRKIICLHFCGGVLCVTACAAVFGAVVMLLWNCLIPAIFGLAVINFWQAVGLLVLARVLFGGFGFAGKMALAGGSAHHHGHHFNKNKMREKWAAMTPEERKNFINERKEFFGKWHGHSFRHGFCEEKETDITE